MMNNMIVLLLPLIKCPVNFNSGLIYIFKNKAGQTKNPLQPTQTQVNKLEARTVLNSFLQKLKPSEWFQVLDNYKDKLYSGKSTIKISDQDDRALCLANHIRSDPNIKNVILLDGHGRFIHTLFGKLGQTTDKILFTVVELNAVVNRWHELFFPNSVKCVCGNIFEFKPSPDTLIYLNFCGIGGLNGQKEFAKYLDSIKPSHTDIKLYVSFSTSRGATHYTEKGKGIRPDDERTEKWIMMNTYPTNSWLSSYDKSYKADKLFEGPQKDFPTYLLTFNKSE